MNTFTDCPPLLARLFCHNGGRCRASYHADVNLEFYYCVCAPRFSGYKCERSDSPPYYGHYMDHYMLQSRELMIIALVFLLLVFLVMLALIASYYLWDRRGALFYTQTTAMLSDLDASAFNC